MQQGFCIIELIFDDQRNATDYRFITVNAMFEQQLEIFRVSLSTLEEERHRIAENLHNGLGQILYGAKLSLAGLKQEMPVEKFIETKNYADKLLAEAI